MPETGAAGVMVVDLGTRSPPPPSVAERTFYSSITDSSVNKCKPSSLPSLVYNVILLYCKSPLTQPRSQRYEQKVFKVVSCSDHLLPKITLFSSDILVFTQKAGDRGDLSSTDKAPGFCFSKTEISHQSAGCSVPQCRLSLKLNDRIYLQTLR